MALPFNKSYTSALCIVPPRSAWEALQRIRCFNDRNFIRWPPHINLIYPFVHDQQEDLQAAAKRAAEALSCASPFELTMNQVSHFQHSNSCTVWLGPSSEELLSLQTTLAKAFPDFNELSLDPQRNIREFRPHLSLGQWSHRHVQQGLQDVERDYEPITFKVDKVDIISRQGPTQPFKFRYKVPVGGNAEADEVNVPYIATVSSETKSSSPLAKQYGLGAVQEGVWYFAFGANMSMRKLTGSRGITPLESKPASLPGWALEFNHRGAMGNVIKLEGGGEGPGGLQEAHGILHRLTPHDFSLLSAMEHEYRPTEVFVCPYSGGHPILAVAFISPPERLIRRGLPPTTRYADLLKQGAREFSLEPRLIQWLESLPTVPSDRKRGDEYWQGLDGQYMKMFPKIWKGSESNRGARGGRGGRGRGRGRGRGGPTARDHDSRREGNSGVYAKASRRTEQFNGSGSSRGISV